MEERLDSAVMESYKGERQTIILQHNYLLSYNWKHLLTLTDIIITFTPGMNRNMYRMSFLEKEMV